MSETILAALIAGITAVLGSLIAARSKDKELDTKNALFQQEIRNEIADIKAALVGVGDRLDKHNGYAEKFAEATKDIALIQKDIEYLKGRP